MTLLSAALAFLAVDLLAVAGGPPWLAVLIAAPAAWLLPARQRRGRLGHLALALGVVAFAIWYLPPRVAPARVGAVASLAGRQVRLLVRAEGDGDPHPAYDAVTAQVLARADGGGSLDGRLRLLLPPQSDVRDDDEWLVAGVIEAVPADGGYGAWLRDNGFDGSLAPRLAQLQRRAATPPWIRFWRRLRLQSLRGLRASLPPREAALAETLVFGGRHVLPAALQADLAATGTTHLATVSAFNLVLLYGLVLASLAPVLGRRPALLLALAVASWYALSVGMRPPVLRGEILLLGLALAGLSGRPRSSLIALVDAAVLLLIPRPDLLRDAAYQLTFAAAAALTVLAPALVLGLQPALPEYEARSARRAAAAALASGSAIALATLPLVAVRFGTVSPYAALANALINPLLPAMTLLALIAGLAVSLAGWLAPLAAPLWLLLLFTERIAHLFASLPLSGSHAAFSSALFSAGCVLAVLALSAWLRRAAGAGRGGVRGTGRTPVRNFVRASWAYAGGAAVAAALVLPGLTLPSAGAAPASGASVAVLPVGGATVLLVTGENRMRLLLSDSDAPDALAYALEDALPAGVTITAAIPLDRRPQTAQALHAVAGDRMLCPTASESAVCAGRPPAAGDGPFEIALGPDATLSVAADSAFEPIVLLRVAGQTILLAGEPAAATGSERTHVDVALLPGWSRGTSHRWLASLSPGAVVLLGNWPAEAVRSLQALLPSAMVRRAGVGGSLLRFAPASSRTHPASSSR
ncbi:MAG TPA: ComEC/Rec2 family competence protein [Dehalococcoidia bacterium]|nr:ComEC/Rec2 family competence protein [Dehalococcoidia bacterium]